MKHKRDWFALSIWALYAATAGVSLIFYIVAGSADVQLNHYAVIMLILLCFLVQYGAIRLAAGMAGRKSVAYVAAGRFSGLFEGIMTCILLLSGAALRIQWMMHRFPGLPEGTLAESAMILEGAAPVPVLHGVTHVYVSFLRSLFLFLGNRVEAVTGLQIVLQLLGIFLFSAAVRRLFGRMPALLFMCASVFLPDIIRHCFTDGPENLYLVLFGLAFTAIAFYNRAAAKTKRWTAAKLIRSILTGTVVGVLCYLDLSGFILLPALLYLAASKKGRRYTVLGAVSGMVLAFLLDAAVSGALVVSVFASWLKLYLHPFSLSRVFFAEEAQLTQLFHWPQAVFCGMALFHAVSLLYPQNQDNCRRNDAAAMLMLPWIALISAGYEQGSMDYGLLNLLCWIMAATLGIAGFFKCGGRLRFFEIEEDTMSFRNRKKEDKAEELEVIELDPPVQYIENPLPVPKKHVKRTMDYAFDPKEDMMKYDIEISAKDDFELK